jgi:hypothetical protein
VDSKADASESKEGSTEEEAEDVAPSDHTQWVWKVLDFTSEAAEPGMTARNGLTRF